MFTANIPDQPPEFSVVLDRDTIAWQHREGMWHPAQQGTHSNCRCTSGHIGSGHRLRPVPWNQLLLERGPLAPMVTEAEQVEATDQIITMVVRLSEAGRESEIAQQVRQHFGVLTSR